MCGREPYTSRSSAWSILFGRDWSVQAKSRVVHSSRLPPETHSRHFRVRAFAILSDEAVDPRRDNGQRYRAELAHGIVERTDVEFETRSFPNLLVATLATLPSMSVIPSAPFAPSVFSAFSRRIVFSQCDASSPCWSWASFSSAMQSLSSSRSVTADFKAAVCLDTSNNLRSPRIFVRGVYRGELAIVRAREKAEKTLGAKLNIRAFHTMPCSSSARSHCPSSQRGSTASSWKTAKALTRIWSE